MIYLDNAASSPLLSEVSQFIAERYACPWAGVNPNSLHQAGREAFTKLEQARKELASCIGARRPSEIIFTSGGTESDNAALLGVARALKAQGSKRRLILCSALEHEAVRECKAPLAELGFDLVALPVCSNGYLDMDYYQNFCKERGSEIALVSCIYVHNEFGVIQPLAEISKLAHSCGALMHSDAVQALSYLPCKVSDLGLDLMSITAHKMGGPTGVGALYLKARTPYLPLIYGGGQEMGRRSGTQQLVPAQAFAYTALLQTKGLSDKNRALEAKRDKFYRRLDQELKAGLERVKKDPVLAERLVRPVLSHETARHPGIVSLAAYRIEAESVVLRMDELGFCISSGSACSSASLEPSASVKALGLGKDYAYGLLRISFDGRVSEEDLDKAACALSSVILELQG